MSAPAAAQAQVRSKQRGSGANLEAMAAEEQNNVLQQNTSEVPSDSELFTGEVRSELSERDVFVGDEDFYKLLEDFSQAAEVQQPAGASQTPLRTIQHKRFSGLQKVLIAAIIVIGAILLYALLEPLLRPLNKIPTPTAQQARPSESPVEDSTQAEGSTQVVQEQIQEPEPLFPPAQPLSLEVARNFYLQKDYDKAYAAYNQLRQSIPAGAEEELLKDFLQLKMALCLRTPGNHDQANSLFRTLSQSQSPVVRVVANYNLSFAEVQKKQYLKARTRAYQTIAMVEAVDFDKDWALSLQRDCHFLIAESMTRNILSLCDADTDLPNRLWSPDLSGFEIEPFTSLDETQLRVLLNSGSKQLTGGLLGPQIQKLEHQGVSPRWSVVAYGASVEELLARFTANAGLDISWVHYKTPADEPARNAIRKRPVSLYLPAATAQQAVETAAGHVGLLARLDENRLVKISNPADYSSLTEHVSLLIQDTISLWRKIILTFHNDKRIPNTHFALGLLHAQNDQLTNAIAEYKLVANHFSQTALAPYALLNSSKLKANFHDYSGAREDLAQLVEQYPDTEFYGQACLNLADATKKAGIFNEAERLYRKVYNLSLSLESQTTSALGAGRCSYETQDYETAARWLTQYLKLANDRTDADFYSAYFFLGKTNLALNKPQQACAAFQFALSGPAGRLTREKYVETVSALVETQLQLELFVEAFTLLESIHSWQFSKKESIEILLLKSKVLRFMDLPDKAIAVLGDVAEYLPDSQLKTRVSFELANCYIAKGDLEFAHEKLAKILISAAPGPLAHEVALELAQVALKLGQNSQTVSVCLQLLDSAVSAPIKQKVLKVLAAAYNRQKKYDDAALALLGQR
ncbi:MAG: tetratricopeptide repeat protein [Planctomycetota bacterium]